MAPPPSRRPGYNRKAQYGLFASYVIAVAGALLGLLLAIISIFDPTGFGVVRNMTAEITRPVSLTLQGMVSGIGSADEHIVAYVRAGSQNAALRRQVEANRTRIIEAAAIEQENRRLKKLLKLVETEDDEVVAARMISSTRSEEHTSELQSLMRISYAVFSLKKKKQEKTNSDHDIHQKSALYNEHIIHEYFSTARYKYAT